MKNKILLFICLIFRGWIASADDGGAYNPMEWEYGHIYVDKPNEKIALQKEFMHVTFDRITATFDFLNLSDDSVTVDCAFPIQVNTKIWWDTLCSHDYQISPREDVFLKHLSFLLKRKVNIEKIMPNDSTLPGGGVVLHVTGDEIRKLDKKLTVYSADELQKMDVLFDFHIEQDGTNVPIENVGVETSTDEDILVTYHIHHHLKFAPKQESKVVVSYNIDSWRESHSSTSDFFYYYDIYTGGTWAGSMQSFMLLTPFNVHRLSSAKEPLSFEALKTPELNLYYTENYKPEADERLLFSYTTPISYYFPIRRKSMDLISNVKCSDAIESPEHLTDGSIYTSCSTKDWQSAWIDFSLNNYAIGPLLVNGRCGNVWNEIFLRSEPESNCDINYKITIFDEIYKYFQDSLWNNSNRLKNVQITFPNKNKEILKLKDIYTATPTLKGWLTSNSVTNPRLLSPGTYRLEFKDVYKGEKNLSTGLSEMWFLPVDKKLYQLLENDRKSKTPVFSSVMDIINSRDWTDLFDRNFRDWEECQYKYMPTQTSKEFKEKLEKFEYSQYNDFYDEDYVNKCYDNDEIYLHEYHPINTNHVIKELSMRDSTHSLSNDTNVQSLSNDNDMENSSKRNWIILLSIALLLMGGAAYMIRRRKRK